MGENTAHKWDLRPGSTSCETKSASYHNVDVGSLPTLPPVANTSAGVRLPHGFGLLGFVFGMTAIFVYLCDYWYMQALKRRKAVLFTAVMQGDTQILGVPGTPE